MKMLRFALYAFSALVSFALTADDLIIGDETVTFDSDEERSFDSLTMGCAAKGNVSELNITAGTTTFGPITINGGKNNATSRIVIGGDAAVTLGDITCNNSWSYNNEKSYLIVTNDAQVTLNGYSGNKSNGPVYQYALFAGSSHTVQTAGKRIETYPGGMTYTYIDASENAYVELQDPTLNFYDAQGTDPGYLHIRGNATLVIKGTSGLVGGKDVNGVQSNVVQVADFGSLILDGSLTLGSGGVTMYGGILLKDKAKMVVTSAGSLVLGWNNSQSGALIIEDNAEFVSSNNVVMLRGYDNDNGPAYFYLNGGVMQVAGFSYGGTQSNPTHGDRRIYANGGTLKPMSDKVDFVRYFTMAEMSGEGLTIDTDGHDVSIRQAFTGTKVQKAGAGTLTVSEASEHETTVVRGGTLKFPAGVTSFGKALVVAGGTLSTAGDGTIVSCEALTLGDGTSAGILEIDGSDVVTVADAAALSIVNGQIRLPDAETLATVGFLKVASGTVDAAALERLSVNNALLTREYEFKAVPCDDGVMIQVEIKAVSSSFVTWTGATDAAWFKPGNWSPMKVPTISANVTFPDAASRKAVMIDADAAALKMMIGSDYSFSGDGVLTTPAIELAEGAAVSFANPIAMPSAAFLTVPSGAELSFNGALSTASDRQTVNVFGGGRLTVSGDNAAFSGSWNFIGATGTVEFASANAAGVTTAEGTMSVGPSTLVFAGNAAQTVTQLTLADPGADKNVTIFKTGVDTDFSSGIDMASGAFVKVGAGTMAAYYAGGAKRYIAKSTPDTGLVGRGTYSPVALPESGSGVTTGTGFSGVNVLEGALVLDGVSGAQVSDNNQYSVIGGNYSNGTANAVLHVKRISLMSGQGNRYTIIGNFPPEGAMDRPAAIVTDGATWEVGELALGAGYTERTMPYYPTLAVTNAEVKCNSALHIGSHRWCHAACIHPVVRIGPGGKVGQHKGGYPNVLRISRNVDVLVDGGELYDFSGVTLGGGELADRNCAGKGANNYYSGELKFVNGGKFTVCKINSVVTLADKSLMTDFIFDGGILKLKETATSYVADPANVKVTTVGAGLEVQIASGITHSFAIPITGTGGLLKTGAGTLVLTNRAEDVIEKIAAFTGKLVVNEGVVDFCGANISNIGAVSGAGIIRNATGLKTFAAVKGATEGALTTFEGVSFDRRLRVDFSGSNWTLGERVPVLRVGAGAMPNLKAINVGDKLSASFAVVDGVVWATVCNAPGFAIVVR